MDRLLKESHKNHPEEYDRIYFEREEKGVDRQDIRRWNKLNSFFRGGRLLDIGCLDSKIPELASKKYPEAEVLGIDLAARAIAAMSVKYVKNPKLKFEVRDLYDTKLPDISFDYVVMGEVIEHLEDPEKAIAEAMRVLKSKGTLALSTPMDEAREPGAVDGHRHLWSFNVKDIIKLLRPYGEVKVHVLGSEYFPTYVYHFPSIIAWCKKK